jgi:hypothetical protein
MTNSCAFSHTQLLVYSHISVFVVGLVEAEQLNKRVCLPDYQPNFRRRPSSASVRHKIIDKETVLGARPASECASNETSKGHAKNGNNRNDGHSVCSNKSVRLSHLILNERESTS